MPPLCQLFGQFQEDTSPINGHNIIICPHENTKFLEEKLPYQPKILAGIKFGSWALNRHCKSIGGFKIWQFGKGSQYVCSWKYEIILVDSYLAVSNFDRQTAKF